MATQLTVFIENRPGRLNSVSQILLENELNVWAFTIQDRGEFGLIKMIVDKPKQAHLILSDRGFACAMKDVFAISAADRPGNLNKLTNVLLGLDVNISDAYGFVAPTDKCGICFLEIKNPNNVDIESALTDGGFKILDDEELYEL